VLVGYLFVLLPLEHDPTSSSPFSGSGAAITLLIFIFIGATIAFKLLIESVVMFLIAMGSSRASPSKVINESGIGGGGNSFTGMLARSVSRSQSRWASPGFGRLGRHMRR